MSPPTGSYRGRYAPTPSGPLHEGNLRTALLAWLLARSARGAFILRLDDLDAPRVKAGAANQVLADLAWLGLDWDEGPDRGGPYALYTQSGRRAEYDAAIAALERQGCVYPCYCSRADIARAPDAPHAGDEGTRYPGTCRDPSSRAVQERRAGRRPPALRLRVPPGVVGFVDELYGPMAQDVEAVVGDIVIRRGDGTPSYQLAVAIDDAAMRITNVVRGADLLASTPRQLVLHRLLGLSPPRYLHLPLAVDASGERLAKRQGRGGLDALRDAGLTPPHVVGALAASVGLVARGAELGVHDLLETFDPSLLARAPSRIVWPTHEKRGPAARDGED